MSLQGLALRRKVLREKHPDTVKSLADWAAAYYIRGYYSKAEKIYLDVLALRSDLLGDKHYVTIRTIVELLITYYI